MADLEPLIRYRQYGVDEKRRILAQLYREEAALEGQKKIILDQVEKEKKLTKEMGTVETVAYLGRYLEGARRRVYALDESLRKMDVRIGLAQEDMRNAFADMKKIEITQRNRLERERAALQKKEDQELDEMAIEGFRRREQE